MATRFLVCTFLISFVSLFLFVAPALAFERITQFDSVIEVQRDTSVEITETIRYITTESKHGIYRYVPVRYSRNGLNYTTRIHSIKVQDEQGKSIQYEQSWDSGNVVLKIGDPDRTFLGPKTYVISYQVDNAVQQVGDAKTPELYWDITGEGWQVEIASVSARVVSPDAGITKVACYAGVVSSDDKGCSSATKSTGVAEFTYSKGVTYGENVTVAVELDSKGGLVFPTPTQKAVKSLKDNLGLIPLLIPGGILAVWWWLRGRDREFLSWNVFNHSNDEPQQTAPLWNLRHIPMVYEPIKELTPGEAGAIHDERVDNEDVIAEIIDLARQKYLKIERLESKKFFFIPDTDYVFTKLKEGSVALPKHQMYLMTHIFSTGDIVKLSELKGSFYTHMEQVKTKISKSLKAKGLFMGEPQEVRGVGFSLAIVTLIITGWWGIHLLTVGLFWEFLFFAVWGFGAFLAANNLPAKTATGSNYAWQVRGLRRSIQYGAWREKLKEKDLFFEEILPFAIALGVVDKLVRDMKDLNVPEPSYLASTGSHYWATNTFINSFSAQAASSLSYNPSSSSWSSGSGFSGGSSGGGGGGGGGGSW